MTYERDWDSITNQDIKGRFIGRHVDGCFSTEVEYILSRRDDDDAPFAYDDIENSFVPYCLECGEGYTSFTRKENDGGETVYRCDDCGHVYTEAAYHDLDTEPSEIYEWWAVSEFLAERLLAHGEPIIEGPICWYWGRGTSGQAILLDGVISRICEEMGILDGQPYSWADRTA